MKKIFFFLVVMMAVNGVMAQAPGIQWAKCYGGSSNDEAFSIQKTVDGGYIMAGETQSNDGDITGNHGNDDCWIVKLDSVGLIQWQKTLGGTSNDAATSIQLTSDGGYIVGGQSTSNNCDVSGHHGDSLHMDFWIVKLNTTGTIQWQKSLGGSNSEFINSVQQTNDGGFIAAGYSYSNDGDVIGNHGNGDAWIVKIDLNGNIQWQKPLGGSSSDALGSIQQTTDSGYIVVGTSKSNDGDVSGNHGDYDFWIVRLDLNGNIQWQKSLGGTGDDVASSIQQSLDGGYIIAGYPNSTDGDVIGNHGMSDYWVVKMNTTGTIQWQKCLGGTSIDRANSIKQTTDKGYIVLGYTMSNDGDVTGNHSGYPDYWIVKLDSIGNFQWQKSLGGIDEDYAYSILQTFDSGYIVAGTAWSSDGDVTNNHGVPDIWVVKLAGPTGINEIPTSSISISPNPTTGIITIKGITQPKVAVYNLMGQKVVAAQGSNEVSLANLPAGMYMVQVFNKDMELVKSEKVILNR